MKTKKIGLLGFISITLLLLGCIPNKIKPLDTSTKMPTKWAFTNTSKIDTLSSVAFTWREYYKDLKLAALIDTALVNNYDIKRAAQNVAALQSDVLLAKGSLSPTLGLATTVSQRKFGLYTMDGSGNATTEIIPGKIVPVNLPDYYLGLQTSWEIDIWSKLKNRKKAAYLRLLGSEEGRNIVITNLIANVADRYYELLALDQILSNIDSSIALQESILKVIKYQKDANRTTELGVKQFEALLLNLKSYRIEVEQEIIETEGQINLLLGRYPQPIERSILDIKADMPFAISVGSPASLVKNRADIRQAELNVLATHADLKAARAAFYPSLSINANIGFQAFRTGLLFTSPQSFAYGLFTNLAQPLVNRAAIKADFNRANAYQLDALYNYQQVVLNSFTEVNTIAIKMSKLEQFVDLKSKEVDVLNSTIDISNELFKSSRADYIDLLLAQQSALQSSLALVNARKQQYQAAVYLYKALGGR